MNVKIELRKSKPLLYSYKGKEKFEEVKWCNFETLLLTTDQQDLPTFKGLLRQIIAQAIIEKDVIVRFSEINSKIMHQVEQLLAKSQYFKIYPSQKKMMYYKPGMILSTINRLELLEKLLEYWGSVDFFQIILVKSQLLDDVFSLLEKDVYELAPETLLLVLESSSCIIADSGDGNEAEIIFNKNYYNTVKKIILEATLIKKIELVEP